MVVGLSVLVLIVLLNACFVAAEYGLVASRRDRIETLAAAGDTNAGRVLQALNDLARYISATQIGITIAGLALGFIGEPVIAAILAPLLQWLPADLPLLSAHVISVVCSFMVVTYITVLASELIPKRIAIHDPERMAKLTIGPMRLFLSLFRPLIWVLNASAGFILKRLGVGDTIEHSAHTEEELRHLIQKSEEGKHIEAFERQLVDRAFTFGDVEAQQIMVPRLAIQAIEAKTLIAEAAWPEDAKAMVYTRLPVYEEKLDQIIGFVHLKDILAAMRFGYGKQPIRTIMRKILIVPESNHVDDLMQEMQRRHAHLAILVDDYGETSGLITMEDCLEVLVSDIRDEDDPEPFRGKRRADGSVTFDGRTRVKAITEIALADVDHEKYETIAGYVLERCKDIPKGGERVTIGDYEFRVDKMDNRRIAQLTAIPKHEVNHPWSGSASPLLPIRS